jgi:hypothetical protein
MIAKLTVVSCRWNTLMAIIPFASTINDGALGSPVTGGGPLRPTSGLAG